MPPLTPTGCGPSSITARVRGPGPLQRGSVPPLLPKAGLLALGARQQRLTTVMGYAAFPGGSQFVDAGSGDGRVGVGQLSRTVSAMKGSQFVGAGWGGPAPKTFGSQEKIFSDLSSLYMYK